MSSFSSQAWDFCSVNLCRSFLYCHSLREFICALLLCLEDTFSLESPITLALSIKFLLLHRSLNLGGGGGGVYVCRGGISFQSSHLGLRVPKSVTLCTLSCCRSTERSHLLKEEASLMRPE